MFGASGLPLPSAAKELKNLFLRLDADGSGQACDSEDLALAVSHGLTLRLMKTYCARAVLQVTMEEFDAAFTVPECRRLGLPPTKLRRPGQMGMCRDKFLLLGFDEDEAKRLFKAHICRARPPRVGLDLCNMAALSSPLRGSIPKEQRLSCRPHNPYPFWR